MNQFTKAYERGMRTFHNEDDRYNCPHVPGTAENDWWWAGWTEAIAGWKPEDLYRKDYRNEKLTRKTTKCSR